MTSLYTAGNGEGSKETGGKWGGEHPVCFWKRGWQTTRAWLKPWRRTKESPNKRRKGPAWMRKCHLWRSGRGMAQWRWGRRLRGRTAKVRRALKELEPTCCSFGFFLFSQPPDMGTDTPVTVCSGEVKFSESNTPNGFSFLSFFLSL